MESIYQLEARITQIRTEYARKIAQKDHVFNEVIAEKYDLECELSHLKSKLNKIRSDKDFLIAQQKEEVLPLIKKRADLLDAQNSADALLILDKDGNEQE